MKVGEYDRGTFKKLNSRIIPKTKFFIPDRYPYEHLMYRMDHASFLHHKNCFSFVTSLGGKYYHTPKDEIQTIDFEFLLKTTQNIAAACIEYIH